MGRTVSVWLTDWPITVWSRTAGRTPPPEDSAFALIDRGPRGLALRAVNDAARARGLSRGQSHADARAILPALISHPAEPEQEARAIARLALWCERWSPTVAIDPGSAGSGGASSGLEGLFLGVDGTAHLFGGEAAMLAGIHRALARAAVPARLALADSPGAAWAVARFGGRRRSLVPPGETRETLAPLPIAALRVDGETVALAHRFGLKRIGDLYSMPRAGLARRFRGARGLALVTRLDAALGIEPEALMPHRRVAVHRVARAFAEPRTDMAGLAAELETLAHALAARLEPDGVGARALTFAGFRSDGGVTTLGLRLGAASRNVGVWLRLFREKGLDRLDIGFGVDALSLCADVVEPLAPTQPTLDGDERRIAVDLSELIDRLTARLGEAAVLAVRPRASWLPERSLRWGPAQTAPDTDPAAIPPDPRPRPVLLFDPPEPISVLAAEAPDGAPPSFTWRRVARRVVRAQGPERLSPEWWRGAGARTRDYFRVEDEAGVRYWLFREGLYGWEDEGGARPPGWWIHGLFA
jgi:protein ImuB